MLSFVGEVGSIPFLSFSSSLVPQDVLVVAFLITVSKTKVILHLQPENSAGVKLNSH
jgi:hypothetical protein